MTPLQLLLSNISDSNYDFGSNLVNAAKKSNIHYTQCVANTGSHYVKLYNTDGDSFKIRIANHSKRNLCGRECDLDIDTNEVETIEEFKSIIYNQLPDELEMND